MKNAGKKFSFCFFTLFLYSSILFSKTLQPGEADLRIITNLDYRNNEIKNLREEVTENLVKTVKGDFVRVEYRKYIIKKNDSFFSIMAKTLMDHDTLSSVNSLASLWDIQPGSTWLIPNTRGIAVYGTAEAISLKYHVPENQISKVPGKQSLFFIAGKSFNSSERSFLNGTIFMKPVKGLVSSKYGLRLDPFSRKHQFHKGIDIACQNGTPVVSAASGKIFFTGQMQGYGNLIIIEHENGYRSYYGHLKSFSVKSGEIVNKGQLIALSGDTGIVTGPHLHFEVRRKGQPQNPRMKDIALH